MTASSELTDIVKRLECAHGSPDDAVLVVFEELLVWVTDHPGDQELVNLTFKDEGLGATASDFLVRFLKRESLMSITAEVLQALTPIDVLCGSTKSRVFEYRFGRHRLHIKTGDEQLVGLGFKVWPAAEYASRVLQSHNPLEGRNVLELGAGLGLLSICSALSGAESIVATDFNFPLLDLCNENLTDNLKQSMGTLTRTRFLDWREVGKTDRLDDIPRGSLIIGTDTVYYSEHADWLTDALIFMFSEKIAIEAILVLGLDPVRPGVSRFIEIAKDRPEWFFSQEPVGGVIDIRLKARARLH